MPNMYFGGHHVSKKTSRVVAFDYKGQCILRRIFAPLPPCGDFLFCMLRGSQGELSQQKNAMNIELDSLDSSNLPTTKCQDGFW